MEELISKLYDEFYRKALSSEEVIEDIQRERQALILVLRPCLPKEEQAAFERLLSVEKEHTARVGAMALLFGIRMGLLTD